MARRETASSLTNSLQSLATRMPPQNVEAEQSILGAVLIDADSMIRITDKLKPEDFYREDHKVIFEHMLKLFEKRQPIDILTLTDSLDSSKQLAFVGGAGYIASLTSMVNSSAHIVSHAEIVRSKALLRRLIQAGGKIVDLGYQEDAESDMILSDAEAALFNVSNAYLSSNFVPIGNILSESFDRIDELHRNKGAVRGVPTGFKDLDSLLGGLQRSDLVILAARPSMGKTAFVLNIAENAAVKSGAKVAVFSLEQSKDQLVDRLLCSQAQVDSWKLRSGNLSDEDFPRIGAAMGVLSEAPIFIDDTPGLTSLEIRTKSRRLQMEHGLDMIIIDYLQLMQGRSGIENRTQEISEISRSLKGIARELNVPVIALSQLSRAVEQRPDKRPMLSDLRESGSIEQDADVVMFIYRDEYYDRESEKKNIAEILVRKHRNGPVGEVDLYFQGEQTRFRNLDKRH
ncbi:MAG TPA: replicative DNA helicase [Patescibacteria group bacterium]